MYVQFWQTLSVLLLYIDLINMRHLPHKKYVQVDTPPGRSLVQIKFAFTMFWNSAKDVANALEKWGFPVMGLPSILVWQSDNGHEFVNNLIEEVLATWPGQVQLVSGRPRHSQSEGLVDQTHFTLERMIIAEIVESGSTSSPWTDWLPHIVYMRCPTLISDFFKV